MTLTSRWTTAGVVVLMLPAAASLVESQDASPSAAEVGAAVDKLGSLDAYEIRMEAAKTVRRAAADVAVPILDRTVRTHEDEYVRFRALVLLSGFGQPAGRWANRTMPGGSPCSRGKTLTVPAG